MQVPLTLKPISTVACVPSLESFMTQGHLELRDMGEEESPQNTPQPILENV